MFIWPDSCPALLIWEWLTIRLPQHEKQHQGSLWQPEVWGLQGSQTGIYPLDSPGGWNIIGQTPVKVFDKERDNLAYLKPRRWSGFEMISRNDFDKIKQQQWAYASSKRITGHLTGLFGTDTSNWASIRWCDRSYCSNCCQYVGWKQFKWTCDWNAFPGFGFSFEDSAEIALSGADFGASINRKKVALTYKHPGKQRCVAWIYWF